MTSGGRNGMFYIIGEHRKTGKKKKYAEHRNLVDCYKDIDRLRARYGDSIIFFWRTTLKGVMDT